ncbi:MAG: single-stranded DNA-binding protein [Chlorobi bacterium]|nr:single-stranded DNA-binding protein [Chlorobiota bacterium]
MNGTLNKVMLIGNVGKDVDVFYFDDRSVIARFPLATSETYRDPSGQRVERTEWHRIVARNQIAEIFKRYLKKGDKIYIEGKIRTREYTGPDGVKKYYTEIHVQHFTFLSPKHPPAGQGPSHARRDSSPYGETERESLPEDQPTRNSQPENGDDDLPF